MRIPSLILWLLFPVVALAQYPYGYAPYGSAPYGYAPYPTPSAPGPSAPPAYGGGPYRNVPYPMPLAPRPSAPPAYGNAPYGYAPYPMPLAPGPSAPPAYGNAPYGYAPYPRLTVPGQPAAPSYRPYAPPPRDNAPPASLSRAMLDAHNAIRARLGEPALTWSPQLAAVAQDWAHRLIATRSFAHRPANRYGENLYTISGGAASPRQVVDAWAAEVRAYDIRSNSCSGMCGHYTQIVWRNTRSVGCAVATDQEREIWACNYDPPGNVVGYRPY